MKLFSFGRSRCEFLERRTIFSSQESDMSPAKPATALKVVPSFSTHSATDDHTLLRPDATRDEVAACCDEARQLGFWSVCVNPTHVPLAVSRLRGSGVKVSTVIGFPFGATLTTVKRFEASECLRLGAAELDMAINLGALKSGDRDLVRADIHAVADLCHSAGGRLKAVLETALLTQSEKALACELALAAGADFVKTSNGAGANGAATEDVMLMRRIVGDRIGVKAAGDIHTLDQFRAIVNAGASRVGTSSGPQILAQLAS
jgi:deoxyribose-phosphate aldolase